jgi:hypothetical protein
MLCNKTLAERKRTNIKIDGFDLNNTLTQRNAMKKAVPTDQLYSNHEHCLQCELALT